MSSVLMKRILTKFNNEITFRMYIVALCSYILVPVHVHYTILYHTILYYSDTSIINCKTYGKGVCHALILVASPG